MINTKFKFEEYRTKSIIQVLKFEFILYIYLYIYIYTYTKNSTNSKLFLK